MKTFNEQMTGGVSIPEYRAVPRYERGMDHLIYLTEDVSYRAEMMHRYLTVLLHPTKDDIVGIKIKGFRFIFERLRGVLNLKEADFVPLVRLMEMLVGAGLGDHVMEAEKQRRYAQALEFVRTRNAQVGKEEVEAALEECAK
jgi:hypothetical protein